MPTISAVIPAYNSAEFLAAAVASIRAQTHPLDEIIIVDDGSTDHTSRLITDLGSDIRYERQENAGPAAARNKGMALASGEWIAFLDADDQWVPEKTAEQLGVVKQFPELALLASDMAEIDRAGTLLVPSVLARHGLLEGFQQLAGQPVPNALAALMRKNFIPTGTVLARRTVLLAAGGFPPDIRWGEDLLLWAAIAREHPIACLPRVHMLRLQHGANATQATGHMLHDLVRVTERVRDAGSTVLQHQGIDADMLLARAWNDLGYWYFAERDAPSAARAFRSSLSTKINARALLYAAACMLPSSWMYTLRKCKQWLTTGSLPARRTP